MQTKSYTLDLSTPFSCIAVRLTPVARCPVNSSLLTHIDSVKMLRKVFSQEFSAYCVIVQALLLGQEFDTGSILQEIGDCVLMLEGHTGALKDMAIAANGSVVVTASEDGTARAWDLVRLHPLRIP